jgi:hypothetical protein
MSPKTRRIILFALLGAAVAFLIGYVYKSVKSLKTGNLPGRIVYLAPEAPGQLTRAILSQNANGLGSRTFYNSGQNSDLISSPDKTGLAWIRTDSKGETVMLSDSQGREIRELYKTEKSAAIPGYHCKRLIWSRENLIYYLHSGKKLMEIRLINTDSGKVSLQNQWENEDFLADQTTLYSLYKNPQLSADGSREIRGKIMIDKNKKAEYKLRWWDINETAWAPDNLTFAYRILKRFGKKGIYQNNNISYFNVDTMKQPARLTEYDMIRLEEEFSGYSNPSWSPDSKYIVCQYKGKHRFGLSKKSGEYITALEVETKKKSVLWPGSQPVWLASSESTDN